MTVYPELAPCPAGMNEDAWVAACARVRSAAGWHIAPVVTETVTVAGAGLPYVAVRTLRLLDVSAATDQGVAVTPKWRESGYVYPDAVGGSWGASFDGVQLTIRHGYEQCPEDLLDAIKAAVGSVVPAQYAGRRLVAGPFQSDLSKASASVIWTPDQLAVIDHYTLPPSP